MTTYSQIGPDDRHAIAFSGPINNIHEAPVIGNGELAAMLQVFQNEVRFTLGKHDLWDARFDHVAAETVLTQDRLIELERTHGIRPPDQRRTNAAVELADGADDEGVDGATAVSLPDDRAGWDLPYPNPKPAGRFRLIHSGWSSTTISGRIDIRRGVAEVDFHFDYGVWGEGALHVEAFVDHDANVLRLKAKATGKVGPIHLVADKLSDEAAVDVPDVEAEIVNERCGLLMQTIPAGFDVEAFRWSVGVGFVASGDGCNAATPATTRYGVTQACTLTDGGELTSCVAVVTDRDAAVVGRSTNAAAVTRDDARRTRAMSLVNQCGDDATHATSDASAGECYAAALSKQTNAWAAFWQASGVSLDDFELEATWYRNLYGLACHIGQETPGFSLCANIPVGDRSPWHGVYTVNMNIQKAYLASLPAGRFDWIENYARWLAWMTPSFERQAKLTFDLEGVYSDHMLFPPWVPAHRQHVSNTCGRSLGMTGWHAWPLWQHWRSTGDRAFLEARTWPYLAAAARFYAGYLDKYDDGTGDIYPSMNLESPGWTPGFAHNRDCIVDLIMFRHTFAWAIEASEELGGDEAERDCWRAAAKRVRPIQYQEPSDEFPRGWIARDRNEPEPGCDQTHPEHDHGQAMWAAWTVFPGEYVDGDEQDPVGLAATCRSVITQMTDRERHPDFTWIHLWWCAIPGLRMQLPGAFDHARQLILQERFPAGHAKSTHYIHLQPGAWRCPEDQYIGVCATTEMLLQSQGEVVRLFPNWPADQQAAFRGLIARGGFRIDATQQPSEGGAAGDMTIEADLESLAGRACRLRRSGDDVSVTDGRGQAVVCSEDERDGRNVCFATERGRRYHVRMA